MTDGRDNYIIPNVFFKMHGDKIKQACPGPVQSIVYWPFVFLITIYISRHETLDIQNCQEIKEKLFTGEARVQQVFEVTIDKKKQMVAGCLCLEGPIHIDDEVRLKHGDEVLYEGMYRGTYSYRRRGQTQTCIEGPIHIDDEVRLGHV